MNSSTALSAGGGQVALGARDLAILGALAEYRFLTREQVERLFFGLQSPFGQHRRPGTQVNGAKRASRRLQQLHQAGLVRRLLAPRGYLGLLEDDGQAPSPYARAPYLYQLTPAGVRIVAAARGLQPDDLAYRPGQDLKPWSLAHDLALNDIRLTLAQVAASTPGWQLVTWRDTNACLESYRLPRHGTRSERHVFAPDGFVHLRTPSSQDLACFFEVDRGTEDLGRRIAGKVQEYLRYAKRGLYQRRYGLKLFRVAFVTTATEARAANLREEVRRHAQGLFWFSTRREFLRVDNPLLASVWTRDTSPDPRPFWLPSLTR